MIFIQKLRLPSWVVSSKIVIIDSSSFQPPMFDLLMPPLSMEGVINQVLTRCCVMLFLYTRGCTTEMCHYVSL